MRLDAIYMLSHFMLNQELSVLTCGLSSSAIKQKRDPGLLLRPITMLIVVAMMMQLKMNNLIMFVLFVMMGENFFGNSTFPISCVGVNIKHGQRKE